MNTLSQKAMLASLTISQWSARRLDRQVTDEVNEAHNASKDAGRYNKLLISRTALDPIWKVVSVARVLHLTMTQPWFNQGARILPAKLFEDYSKRMRDLRTKFEREADIFAEAYPAHVEQRKAELNGLYRDKDYPAPDRVRSLFGFDVAILPCPNADDFRVSLSRDQANDIRLDIERRMKAALDDAMREPVRRVVETVGRMAERLKAYRPAEGRGDRAEGVFRDTLVSNVRDLVALLPAFNLTDDPALAKIAERMQAELCVEDAPTLRENAAARASVAQSADDILARAKQLLA